MSRQKELVAHLLDAFPPRAFSGDALSHDCPGCAEIRAALDGATWWALPGQFIQQYADQLPLLTKEAYQAFLPAWLREAVADPTGEIAKLAMASLSEGAFASHYSTQQSYAVVRIAKWLSENNGLAADDPANVESIAKIKHMWGEHGA